MPATYTITFNHLTTLPKTKLQRKRWDSFQPARITPEGTLHHGMFRIPSCSFQFLFDLCILYSFNLLLFLSFFLPLSLPLPLPFPSLSLLFPPSFLPSPGSEDQRGKVERHGLRPPYFSLSFHSHNFLESEPSHPFPLWSTLAKNFCGLANQDWSLIC